MRLKSALNLAGTLICLALSIAGILTYRQYTQAHPSTDDAYLSANVTHIASEINGRVKAVYRRDHQAVKRGDTLFLIDQTPYLLEKEKMLAQLELTRENLGVDQDEILKAKTQVTQNQAVFAQAKKQAKRIITLAKQNRASHAEADEAKTKVKVAYARLNVAKNQLEQAKKKVGKHGEHNAKLRQAKANLAIIENQLKHTLNKAPVDGVITQLKLRPGDMVSANQPLFAIVEDKHWWMNAHFKETQLENIKVGQKAKITLDMYPSLTLQGTVESIDPSSGNSFSLLPQDNGSGNWVKVTQRFAVKIRIDDRNAKFPFRSGASGFVKIDR